MISLEENRLIIPYHQCRRNLELVQPGYLITSVKTADLFTLQDWLDPTKFMQAMSQYRDGSFNDGPPIGYIVKHKEHRVIAIGDGNHRALIADLVLGKVDIQIADNTLAENNPVFSLRSLRRKYNTLCAEGL